MLKWSSVIGLGKQCCCWDRLCHGNNLFLFTLMPDTLCVDQGLRTLGREQGLHHLISRPRRESVRCLSCLPRVCARVLPSAWANFTLNHTQPPFWETNFLLFLDKYSIQSSRVSVCLGHAITPLSSLPFTSSLSAFRLWLYCTDLNNPFPEDMNQAWFCSVFPVRRGFFFPCSIDKWTKSHST